MEILDASERTAARDHVARAEREARIGTGASDAAAAPIERACVVGAGTMGAGIALALADGGIAARVVETSAEQLARGRGIIERTYDAGVRKGRLTEVQAEERLRRLSFSTDVREAVSDADLAIEAVNEDLSIKRDVFTTFDRAARAGTLLATNTSTLDIDAIAAVTSRPQDVIGLHFFSPANVMRLLEIVRGTTTSASAIATAFAFAERIGKVGVLARTCDGFIGNRMLAGYRRETYLLLEEGATPQEVDAALRAFGFAMGPFAVYDLAGLDIGWRVKQRRIAEGRTGGVRESEILDRLCERGRFGQKTGAGVYRYADGSRTPLPDPAVDAIVRAEAERLGIVRRSVGPDEMVQRCVLALVNEGARIVGDGIALRASDVDLVWVYGYGFPADRGGPMYWADALGLDEVVARLRALEASQGAHWTPAPLLSELARTHRRLSDLAPGEAAAMRTA